MLRLALLLVLSETSDAMPFTMPCSIPRASPAALCRRHLLALSAAVAGWPAVAAELPSTERLLTETFSEKSLGLVLRQAGDRIQVEKIVPGSAASERGVLPLSYVDRLNDQRLDGMPVKEVSALLKRIPRPITLSFDATEYVGMRPDEAMEKAASSQGIETDRVRITPLGGVHPPTLCGLQTREGDVIEVEFTARVLEPKPEIEFDSSAMRSGRPFAFLLGNGDVVRGFELGCFEMCIGDERLVSKLLVSPFHPSTLPAGRLSTRNACMYHADVWL